VPEDRFQLFEFQRRRDPEHPFVAIETSVRQKDVAVGIESEKVAEGLHGNHRAGDGLLFRYSLLHKNFQGFPCAAAEGGEKFSIIQKVTAKHFGNTEYEMPVGYLFKDIHTEPLTEFHHALLVTGRAEMTAFTRECQQIFMAAALASDTGKTVAQIAAVEVTVYHLFNIGPPETVIP